MLFDMKNPDFGDFSIIPPIVAKDDSKDSAIIKQRGDIDYYSVFEPEQIHILGTKQDIDGFKKFVDNKSKDVNFQLKEPVQRNQKTYNEIDADLKTRMFAILSKLGVSVTSIDTMMLDYGVDALGVADFMNKAIKLAKDEATDFTFMEEFAHFVTASLGDNHPLITRLHSLIKETDFYEAVKEQYNVQKVLLMKEL
jgi:hypothetical protein